MFKVGLTGGIGSGKTTVSDIFKKHGVAIIDTDIIAHDLVNKDSSVLTEIETSFGKSIIHSNGSLNRQQLAKIVFSNKQKKTQLESILHPKIRAQVKRQIQTLETRVLNQTGGEPYCIIVIPLLFETSDTEISYHQFIDRTLLIVSDEPTRIQRIKNRDDRCIEEIHSIIKMQKNDDTKISKADDVLVNNACLADITSQVAQLHKKYLDLAGLDGL